LLLAVLLCAGAITGCRQTSTSPGGTSRILAITPSIVDVSTAPQVMRFSGANLGSSYSLVMISPGGSITEIPPSQLQVLGSDTFQATVMLPSAGIYAFEIKSQAGEVSNPFELTVGNVSGFPTITSVIPSAVQASAQARSFSIFGTHFESGLTVVLAGPDGTISTVSPGDVIVINDTTFQANLLLSKVGAYLVSVVNPSGGSSNLMSIAVTK